MVKVGVSRMGRGQGCGKLRSGSRAGRGQGWESRSGHGLVKVGGRSRSEGQGRALWSGV